jgi:steroid delta-isomerase-like uncharacterized protein
MAEIKEKMSVKERINEHIQAVNKHDLKAFAASFREDATVYDPMYPEPLKGRHAIRKDMEEFMTAFPDLRGTLGWVVESGDTVAYEVIARGTHKGPLTSPTGPIPATNRTMAMPIATFAQYDDQGLVVEERRYYDLLGVMQQLEVISG